MCYFSYFLIFLSMFLICLCLKEPTDLNPPHPHLAPHSVYFWDSGVTLTDCRSPMKEREDRGEGPKRPGTL